MLVNPGFNNNRVLHFFSKCSSSKMEYIYFPWGYTEVFHYGYTNNCSSLARNTSLVEHSEVWEIILM